MAALAPAVEPVAQDENGLRGGRQLAERGASGCALEGAIEGAAHGLIDRLGAIRPALIIVASAGPRGAQLTLGGATHGAADIEAGPRDEGRSLGRIVGLDHAQERELRLGHEVVGVDGALREGPDGRGEEPVVPREERALGVAVAALGA